MSADEKRLAELYEEREGVKQRMLDAIESAEKEGRLVIADSSIYWLSNEADEIEDEIQSLGGELP